MPGQKVRGCGKQHKCAELDLAAYVQMQAFTTRCKGTASGMASSWEGMGKEGLRPRCDQHRHSARERENDTAAELCSH